MKDQKHAKKTPLVLLCIALILMFVGSFLAGLFHTSFYSVKVKRIEFETDRGTLTGLLYMPKGAGPEDPRPVIVTTHGYLNTKEMQDAPAIEMSRRGYIVLALDMYDHGDSRWAADIPVGEEFGTFWIYSQFDAVNYMYQQPYTKKDEDGNAYIAVSGHSMGGFSSFVAMYMDEMTSLQTGVRMIYAGIPAGADLTYAMAVAPMEQLLAAYGNRTVGVIAAHYDEFFFNKLDDEKTPAEKEIKGTVVYKDYPATALGKIFLGLSPAGPAGEAGRFYEVESGDLMIDNAVVRPSQTGQHIVYTPGETHPWNHFSATTTASFIEFYTHAFNGVTSPNQQNVGLASGKQIWQWKEFFSMVAMIGFFLLIVPLAMLLLKVPFLKKAVTEEGAALAAPANGAQKAVYWVLMAASIALPAVLFRTLMDRRATGLKGLYIAALVVVALALVAAVLGFVRASSKKDDAAAAKKCRNIGVGGIVLAIAGLVLFFLFWKGSSILRTSSFFIEPTVNQIVYWAIANGLMAALFTIGYYYFINKNRGEGFEKYGIRLKVMPILASLCTALLAVAAAYLVLFCTQAIFGTDYRIWTLAVRTFKPAHVATALRYVPFFFIYYFINVVALNANTRGRKGGYAMAILLNVGGLLVWMGLQYGLLFATGTAAFPDQSLNGILMVALIPCLAIAAVYARKLYEKTNNVWLPAFVNTLLFTMINAANTAMFWNMV